MKFCKFITIPLTLLFLCAVSGVAIAAELSSIDLRPGVTEISKNIYGLHVYAFWVCVAIAVVVYGIMVWSLFKYRKSKGAKPASFSHSTVAEVIWTIIPIIILVVLAVPSVKVLSEMYDTSDSELDVLVTGYQWKWKYEYLDHNYSFFSNLSTSQDAIYNNTAKGENYLLEVDNELVIPIGKKVRFLVTSNDVVHSWWVPDFAVKRDAIPGYINESWTKVDEPGIYRGQCAELCGKDHGFMPVVVRAVNQAEFDTWIASKTSESQSESAPKEMTEEELLATGKTLYDTRCAACHQVTGQGNPPIFPALAGNKLVTSSDPSEVIQVVYFGRRGTAMQAFGEQMKPDEVASVVSYIRNAWGNKAPVVQPQTLAEKVAK